MWQLSQGLQLGQTSAGRCVLRVLGDYSPSQYTPVHQAPQTLHSCCISCPAASTQPPLHHQHEESPTAGLGAQEAAAGQDQPQIPLCQGKEHLILPVQRFCGHQYTIVASSCPAGRVPLGSSPATLLLHGGGDRMSKDRQAFSGLSVPSQFNPCLVKALPGHHNPTARLFLLSSPWVQRPWFRPWCWHVLGSSGSTHVSSTHAASLELLVAPLQTLLVGQGLHHLSLNPPRKSLLHIPTCLDVLPARTYRAWDTPGHRALQPPSPCVPPTHLSYIPRASLGLQTFPCG